MWDYEVGEKWQAKKHAWNRPFAGVKTMPGLGRVAACPNNLTREQAREILNAGLAYFEDEDPDRPADAFPDNIFAVHEGVPYEVRATVRGRSFHGFPILPERYKRLPRSIQAWLEKQVAATEYDIKKWLSTWAA